MKSVSSTTPSPAMTSKSAGPVKRVESSSSDKSKAIDELKKPKQNIGELEKKKADLEKEIKAKEQTIKETKMLENKKSIDKFKKDKKGYLAKPAIIFVGGLDLSSGVSGGMYDGMRLMAKSQHGAKHFNWNQKDEIIQEIEKHKDGYPVIMVGHSFGADTIVEVADELNTLDKGFKKVNLLVTVDAIGSNNDIISQNVQKNLNIISSEGILSDAPNIARNASKTKVENVLSEESHTSLDDSALVQADILQSIQDSIYQSKMSSFEVKA